MRLDPIAVFAARRTQQQDDAIADLLPYTTAWLREPTPETRTALLREVVRVYRRTYADEGGQRRPRPSQYAEAVSGALRLSDSNTDPEVLATLLGVNATNAATVQAALDDSAQVDLEWVTMHDNKVRHTHQEAEGQQQPPGHTFDVAGQHLLYPGQPVGPPSVWINCRCTLAPVAVNQDNAARSGGITMTDTTTEAPVQSTEPTSIAVPWHGVLAPEGKWSGDGRRFADGALTTRPLPLPLTWQKSSADGHGGSVTVAKIENVQRVNGEMRGTGHFLTIPEADEVVGLLADFGRYGVSVDADDAEFEYDDASNQTTFTHARVSSASIVSIPAFAEAWVGLGEPPDGFLPGPDPTPQGPEAAALAEVEFKDYTPAQRKKAHTVPGTDSYPIEDCEDLKNAIQAIGRAKDPAATKKHIKNQASRLNCPDVSIPDGWAEETDEFGRGPGWLTDPVATKRIHDYWTVPGQEGYAKIAWGTPGDFDRCRVQVGQEIAEKDPGTVAKYMNQICAQWHHDALGRWPAEDKGVESGEAVEFKDEEPAPAVSLVASATGARAPAEWFKNPEFTETTHLTITDEGRVFGHLAQWGVCHIGFDGVCVEAPHSVTDYAHFATGQVLLDDGTAARTGVISLGGGHAGRGGIRAATEHYDSTSCAVADVAVGEDEHGIWCAGWVRPGTTGDQVVALRASDVSGDWREVGGNLELVAALAVNVGGFPVARVSQGSQVALVAAGMIHMVPTDNSDPMDELADKIAFRIEAHQRERIEAQDRFVALVTRMKGAPSAL